MQMAESRAFSELQALSRLDSLVKISNAAEVWIRLGRLADQGL